MSGHEGSVPDFSALISQLGQVQQNLQQAQQEAAEKIVEGSAGGGAVRVTATGGMDFKSVTIDPAVIDPAEVEMLEDLVLAAVRDAIEQAHSLASEALGGLGGLAGRLGGAAGGLGGAAGGHGGAAGAGGPLDIGGLLGL